MNFCPECGSKLELRTHKTDGEVPFCPHCGRFRHPSYNTAVSIITRNPNTEEILLIQQYGKPSYILVAGYVNRGESAEDAVSRELREETGLEAAEITFNRSRFFEPSNTLMLNFSCEAKNPEELMPNEEIDSYAWFSREAAVHQIRPNSLAKEFLSFWLENQPEKQ